MSSRPTRTEWQFVTAIKLIRRINYVIFVCNVVSLLFMKYKAKAHYTTSVIYCTPKTIVSTLSRHTLVQFGTVRFNTVYSKVSLPISHHILCKLSVVLATWLAWRHSRRRCRHFPPSRSSTGCRVCTRFFISPDYKYSQCRKVSEYQFHICNPANFFTSQKSTRCSAIAERPRCRVRYSFRQK